MPSDNGADGIEIDERGDGNVLVNGRGPRSRGTASSIRPTSTTASTSTSTTTAASSARSSRSAANDNFEEGFDFNENNAGDLRVDMQLVEANGNHEEGIDYEEDDDFAGGGELVTVMGDIRTIGNRDGGDGALKIREKEAGNLGVTLPNIISTHNIGWGVFVRESSGGNAVVQIENARLEPATR